MALSASCFLYYGPGARQIAIDEAERIGFLMAPPFGDDVLKTDEARDFVRLLESTPVGVSLGTLVAGPMDLVSSKVSDVLLKSIEEFDGDQVRPILWAHDFSGVAPTIQSRCLSQWVDIPDDEVDQELVDDGFDLMDALVASELYRIPAIVKKYSKRPHDLLGSLSDALASEIPNSTSGLGIWRSIRPLAQLKNPTDVEIIAALVNAHV